MRGRQLRGANDVSIDTGRHGRFTILESDPEIYRTGVRLETSASCLEFVIVHYDRVPAARAVSGKTDRP
ncbi:hypothetical protein C7S13_0080 [Burkholderia cepacia]|nr:hypothetical protein [Burkholderia cepacia]